ncbi:MAG TPA: hypothetical protein VJ327_08345 [Patescibacteria group bacterium]|nr:hypothetical protein [Patescibacteria group bacterium]
MKKMSIRKWRKMMSKELRLAVGIPSTDTWTAQFGMSLAFLVAYLSQQVPGYARQQFTVHNAKGSILPQLRHNIIKAALAAKATHVLFIDSDQTFPQDIAHRLLAHKKQVVGCNIATKKLPSGPTARLAAASTEGTPLYTTVESTGLAQVWRLGTGVLLLDMDIFKKPGMIAPWFTPYWSSALDAYTGEDWAFCEKLEKNGINIWVDQDLSKEIGHIGSISFEHDLIMKIEDKLAI